MYEIPDQAVSATVKANRGSIRWRGSIKRTEQSAAICATVVSLPTNSGAAFKDPVDKNISIEPIRIITSREITKIVTHPGILITAGRCVINDKDKKPLDKRSLSAIGSI